MPNNDLENLLSKCSELVNSKNATSSSNIFIKEKIFSTIEKKELSFEEALIVKCKKIFDLVKIDRVEMANIKEYIFDNLPVRRRWFDFSFPLFQKKVWSLAILFIFIFGIFSQFSLLTAPEVYAKDSILYINEGNVELRRDGISFKAQNGQIIQAGDVIQTFENSDSYIQYPDGNSSRFGQNSSVFFEKLNFNPKDITNSEVNIDLNEGRVLNNIYNSILAESRFEVSAENVDVDAVNAIFDVAIEENKDEEKGDIESKYVNVSVINSFVDVNIYKNDKGELENKTVFKQEQMQITNEGQYKLLNLDDAAKDDIWLADNIKEVNGKLNLLADNNSSEVSSLITPIQNAVESILTDDKRDSLKAEIDSIQALFEKAEYYRKKGDLGEAQEYLDNIELRMQEILKNYSNVSELSEIAGKMEDLIEYYRRNRTRFIPGKSYDDYLNTFNDLELLVLTDEFTEKKARIDQSLEALIVSLNQDDKTLIQTNTVNYIENLKSSFDFVSKINEQTKRDDFYSEYAKKSLNIFKSIGAKFSSSDNKEDIDFALNLQKQISKSFSEYRFLDDMVYSAYSEMQGAFITLSISGEIPLEQTDSSDASGEVDLGN